MYSFLSSKKQHNCNCTVDINNVQTASRNIYITLWVSLFVENIAKRSPTLGFARLMIEMRRGWDWMSIVECGGCAESEGRWRSREK